MCYCREFVLSWLVVRDGSWGSVWSCFFIRILRKGLVMLFLIRKVISIVKVLGVIGFYR